MKFTTRLTALIVTIAMLTSFLPVFAADSDMPFRGVWVCTVYQMDFPTKSTVNADTLRAMADKVLDDAKNSGMNAVILQVRPMADSFYKSSIFPWSKYISGKQGVAPSDGFDPLAYYIDGAHKRGMQLHAWINPFRIAPNDADFAALTPDHPAKKNPAWVVHHSDGQYYFNPGIPEVRALLAKGVSEIVDNYNVDGIHLDDYFYPDEGFNDTATFKQYGAGFKTPLDWRRDNITKLVSQLRDISHAAGKVFGVSPAGIWANKSSATPDGSDTRGNESYVAHAADTRLWAKNGLVDYICPQLYWNIGFNVADYKILANWWADVVSGTNTKLYIGMADYKTGAKDAADPWHGTSEMQRQLDLNRTIPEISGEIHFRAQSISDSAELTSLYRKYYLGIDDTPTPPAPPVIPDGPKHLPYIEGANGKFAADDSLTRAQAATLFARISSEMNHETFDKNAVYATTFSDVPQTAWYANAVGFTQKLGLISGYEGGLFKPNSTITRAEFATMISRFGAITSSTTTFPDVPSTHWASLYIANAAARGYISGYTDGFFKPDRRVTRAETVKMVNRLTGRVPDKNYINAHVTRPFNDVNTSHWAYYEIIEAACEHIYSTDSGSEAWTYTALVNPDPDTVGENGFVYTSDTFKFLIPKLKITAPLEPLDLTKVDAIALHHMDHPTADFREVERWHLEDNGWRAIGYNFWIGFDGTVYVGRGFNIGAGVGNHNDHIISIGFQGDFQKSNAPMSSAQYAAGVALMKWLEGKVPSINKAGGHGAWNSTDCPGKYFPLTAMIADSGLTFLPLKK